MAVPKHAEVIEVEALGPGVRRIALRAFEPLDFIGGQYVIVDSGLTLPSGKAVKRAYSLLSPDADPARLELAVMQIDQGPGSAYMHRLAPGECVTFSGPWGKFWVPEATPATPTLILATDTGITAALGLLRSRRFAGLLEHAALHWLRPEEHAFVSDGFVTARVPAACAELHITRIAPADHPERLGQARALLAAALERRRPARVFMAGDGAINYALLDDVNAAGIAATRDHLESFFNMPKKSAAAPAALGPSP